MALESLDHQELLAFDPKAGIIRFAGQRTLLFDAAAMGFLRKRIIESLGIHQARVILGQFGFAHGSRMAEVSALQRAGDGEKSWRTTGKFIHGLQGLFRVEESPAARNTVLGASYEAEQHLMHFGRADIAVCWTVCGLISGYISRCDGCEVEVIEDLCVAKGDAVCSFFVRSRESLGNENLHKLDLLPKAVAQSGFGVAPNALVLPLQPVKSKPISVQPALSYTGPNGDDGADPSVRSARMRDVVSLARRLGQVDSTVLITGESGAGKERIARIIHQASPRVAGPFVAINCGAVSETLLESELFGHSRGAFTGASQDRAGLFEAAHHGTLLLDEVGEISPGMQVKLLRVLQEREVRRIGENKTRKVDVRVIAATNRDLAYGVSVGAFRQDLYYRLKVVDLHVPALRERPEDILPLAREFFAEAAHRMGRSLEGFSSEVADHLMRYSWPGNVRELQNAMERCVALASHARAQLSDLPVEIRATFVGSLPSLASEGVRPLEVIEKNYILAVLARNGGNRALTAEQLKIGTATLYRKLKSYGLIDKGRVSQRRGPFTSP